MTKQRLTIPEIDAETRVLIGRIVRDQASSYDHYALQHLIAERANLMMPGVFKRLGHP